MIDDILSKYVFFDVDGTLSEYRYRDKVYGGELYGTGCQSLHDLLFADLFISARPLKTMQNIVSQLDRDRIFILGAAECNHEVEQKYIWLEKNYPQFRRENIFFISNTMHKPEVIIEYCNHYSIPLYEVAFVDDRIDVIRKAESMGIKSFHPSSFVP